MNRRDFLRLLAAAPLAGVLPAGLVGAPRADLRHWDRMLVLVELSGGNDGLNTLVPYADPAYYDLRPQLGVPRSRVIPISPELGFHTALEPLHRIWKAGHLAVVRGVGYPRPNRSHFRSIDIWETGSDTDEFLDEGWLARLFATAPPDEAAARVAHGVVLGNDAGPLEGAAMRNVIMSNPENLVKQASRLARKARATTNPALQHILKVRADIQAAADEIAARMATAAEVPVAVPAGKFGKSLQGLMRLLAAGIHVPVVKLNLGSFDTHAGQAGPHERLLGELAGGLEALERALKHLGLWDRTLVMTYSEFGRRPKQNASQGTDHGTAAPHFVMGGAVRGGLYGRQPSLTDLAGGDLKHTVHFRDLYTTVARDWWGVSQDFLGADKRGTSLGLLG